jgi:hypothetical protein
MESIYNKLERARKPRVHIKFKTRRTPYSLVLLDELEKAHPGVQDIFYQKSEC